MFRTNAMPRSHNTAFKQRKRRFYGIRVHVANSIDAILVANRLVLCENASVMQSLRVALKFISHDHVNILRDILADVLRQRPRLHVLSVEEAQFAATLPNADDHLFLRLGMAGFVLMATLPSTDGGFVYLNRSAERLRFSGLHRVSDSVAEIPCGAVVDAQHPLKLVCRHPFARLANQKRSKEPF